MMEKNEEKMKEASARREKRMISIEDVQPMKIRCNTKTLQKNSKPIVEIVEEPASKVRFRYGSESRSASYLFGAKSTPHDRTYPTIRVVGFRGQAVVVVSCVTKDEPYRPHPHGIIGRDFCKSGVCRMEITAETREVKFVNIGIQCVKKKDICEALEKREELRIDPFKTGFDHKEGVDLDLNTVRLCFQVFIAGREGGFNCPLPPVVSEPIQDKRSGVELRICKLSHCSATAAGGTEMILLCEKVSRDDVHVRFFERLEGRDVWEGFGEFKSSEVHKLVAITFRTPKYTRRVLEKPLQVHVQLMRRRDGATSEPLPFQLLPTSVECVQRKQKKFTEDPRSYLLRLLQAEAEKEELLDDLMISEENLKDRQSEMRVKSFHQFPVCKPAATNFVGNYANRPNNLNIFVDPANYRTTALPGSNISSPVSSPSPAQLSPVSQPSPVSQLLMANEPPPSSQQLQASQPYNQPSPYSQPSPYDQLSPYNQPSPCNEPSSYSRPSPYGRPWPFNEASPYGQTSSANQHSSFCQALPASQLPFANQCLPMECAMYNKIPLLPSPAESDADSQSCTLENLKTDKLLQESSVTLTPHQQVSSRSSSLLTFHRHDSKMANGVVVAGTEKNNSGNEHQQISLNSSFLNVNGLLDSTELEMYTAALSESIASGLSITDNCNKSENSGPFALIPMSLDTCSLTGLQRFN